ncbi:hypothetical protein AB0F91_42305 [Amycolatopsis sp. NPDC023774]|uniref:hypothetical protein n=1 Tax=Amycolatopsis sp. NPDC023774 TaxID=3155015 RepID=UPI0033FC3C35
MTTFELAAADLWATGITPDRHPIEFLRTHLNQLGATPRRPAPRRPRFALLPEATRPGRGRRFTRR